MLTIASEPTNKHVFMSDGYHELQRKVQTISQAACVGKLKIMYRWYLSFSTLLRFDMSKNSFFEDQSFTLLVLAILKRHVLKL